MWDCHLGLLASGSGVLQGATWEFAMRQRQSDPVIDEVREVRHRISARFDHDPTGLVAFYMEMQKQYLDRLSETGSNAGRSGQSQPPNPSLQPTPLTRRG